MATGGGSSGSVSASSQARQIQRVYSEWCVKAAEIILYSRVDSPTVIDAAPQSSDGFSIKLPELFKVRHEAIAMPEFFQLKTQRSFHVEIYIGGTDDRTNPGEDEICQLLERWTFTFFPANPDPSGKDRFNQTLVQKLRVTLRSLLCFTRLLPVYNLCRGAGRAHPRRYAFRIEAWPPAKVTGAQDLVTDDFVSLQSSVGTLRLSVSHRKDLSFLQLQVQPVQSKGVTTVASQLGKLDVEEGYFSTNAGASDSASPTAVCDPHSEELADVGAAVENSLSSSSRGRLEKIAEDPEAPGVPARQVDRAVSRIASSTASEGGIGADTPNECAHRSSSAEFVSGVASAERAIGNDVPTARLAEERMHGVDSASSSMSAQFEPNNVVIGSIAPFAASPAFAWGSPGSSGRAVGVTLGPSASSSRSQTPHSSPKLKPRSDAPQVPSFPQQQGTSVTARCGDNDDLSNIWMRPPTEWSRRNSVSSYSRGTQSRSLSPEVTGTSSVPRRPAASSGSSRSGAALSGTESGGEICMFGMSDNGGYLSEDGEGPDEDDLLGRNVVASAVQGGGGGAFASPGTSRMDGFVMGGGLDGLEKDETPVRQTSPLIAQLNPFAIPPSLDLPAAAVPISASEVARSGTDADPPHSGRGDKSTESGARGMQQSVDSSDVKPDVQHLLVEMGDLMCLLQQQQEVGITLHEVSPADMLENLDHFKEVAYKSGLAASPRSSHERRCAY